MYTHAAVAAAVRHQQVGRHKRARGGENAGHHGDRGGRADGGGRATSFAYGRHVASVVVYVYARVFAALQTAPDRWCARVVVCASIVYCIHTRSIIYVCRYTEQPPPLSPTPPQSPLPSNSLLTRRHHHHRHRHRRRLSTTSRDDRGFRNRIAAAPPDGSAPDRVTAVVRHTATATTPTPRRSRIACFADTTGTYDIIVAVAVVVVAVVLVVIYRDGRRPRSQRPVRISSSGLRLSHCRIYRFKTVQDCESIAMLRFEACMSSSRRTKSYSCHSVDPQHVSVNSSGPVNVAIATNTVLSQSWMAVTNS
ncbi:unnamed protein product [Macrosiphum euphorbiae]|uniref:Uncharacterized protein n=1 Tax=Macrosiphum euphorbiae TaxID=13131 RepID=A0AAV0XJ56_9HEMI|nr:unnamed protein product [Macrosiphum euphorbiae]